MGTGPGQRPQLTHPKAEAPRCKTARRQDWRRSCGWADNRAGSCEQMLDRGREQFTLGHWAEAFGCLAQADRGGRLAGADLELLARSAYMLGRDDDYVARPRAGASRATSTCRTCRAPCAARSGSATTCCSAATGARDRVVRPGRAVARAARADCVERGYLLIPAWLAADGRRRLGGRLRHRGRGGGDRRAVRRRRPRLARPGRAGPRPDQPGAGR